MAISEKLRKKLEKRKEDLESGGNYNTFLLKDGMNRFRVVNPGDDEDFAFEVISVFLGKDIGSFISPATWGEPCAAVEMHKQLKAGSDDDKKIAETFYPSKKYAMAIYKYKDEKGKEVDDENGVKLLMAPKTVYDQLLDLALDEEKDEFFNPKEGYDIRVKKSGQGKTGTKYNVLECKPTKAAKKYSGAYNPEEMARALCPSYEDTEKMIHQFLGISMDDEPKKKKKKSSTEEATPVKKKKKRTSDM